MQTWLDSLIARGAFGPHPSRDLVYAVGIAIACAFVLFLVAVPFASVVTWVERRVWARIQSRIGPNRVGPNGFLQWLADGIKHVLQGRHNPRGGRRARCSSWHPTSWCSRSSCRGR